MYCYVNRIGLDVPLTSVLFVVDVDVMCRCVMCRSITRSKSVDYFGILITFWIYRLNFVKNIVVSCIMNAVRTCNLRNVMCVYTQCMHTQM